MPGGSRRLLGEVLGQFWPPMVPQGCPRGARSRKSDQKFVRSPFVLSFGGSQKMYFLGICLISVIPQLGYAYKGF